MVTPTLRMNLLFTACLTVRVGFALVAKYIPNQYLPILGYLAFVPFVGFLYQYKYSKKTGVFGQKLWWNTYRLFHSFMCLLFAIFAILQNKDSYIILLTDAIVGLCLYLRYHYFLPKP